MIADDDTPVTGGGDVSQVLTRISAQLDGISAQMQRIEDEELPGLEKRGEANRQLILRAIYAFGIIAALVVAAGAYTLARQDAKQARATCVSANQLRAEDLRDVQELIQYVRVTASHPSSPATRAEAARLLSRYRVKDQPRPCS